jgi:hypothetical protein
MATVEKTTSEKLTNEEYHGRPEIGSSMGKLFRQSRTVYRDIYVTRTREPRTPTRCMDLGTVGHAAILEPHVIDDMIIEIRPEVLTSDGKRAGNAWKSFVADNPDKILFSPADIRRVRGMQQACWEHPLIGKLLRMDGPTEDSLFVTCSKTGLERKCRIDKHPREYIIDFKTTADVSPEGFAKTIAKLDYEFSAAWYCDVCEQATGDRKNFLWAAVSTEPPFQVRTYKLRPEDELTAWNGMERTITDLANCYDSGNWSEPGEFDVVEIGLPAWKRFKQWELSQ